MKSRRGISSVVGTVFAIIALSSTVGYVTYSMTVLDNYNQSVLAKNQVATDLLNEKFQVSSVTYANNKFNITVTNTGSLPVNFTKIWITNSSLPITSSWVKSYAPQTSVLAPGNTLKNIGQNICNQCSFNLSKAYHIKLVTSRGNTNEFDVNSAKTSPLNIQLLANPSSVTSGFNTTLVMLVTNNQTGTFTNITPQALANSNPGVCALGPMSPSTYGVLSAGSTAVFQWNVKAIGVGQSCTFNATLNNGYIIQAANRIQNVITTVKVSPTIPIGTGPLNIQLYTLPPTVPAGFKTKLVMFITNNQTGTLPQITPNTPSNSNPTDCTLGAVSPPNYNNLPPGSTAVFVWDVTSLVTANAGDTCTFSFNAPPTPILNGYSQAVSATTTITSVSLSSTTYAQNSGVVTLDYTSFRWTQGNTWNKGWAFAHGNPEAFSVTLTNNNQTNSGIDSLWISQSSILTYFITPPPNNNVGTAAYVVKTVTLGSPITLTGYCADYCANSVNLLNGGGSATIYFSATGKGGVGAVNVGANDYIGFITLYGKFTQHFGDNGPIYAQNIPFIGLIVS